jgi:hypothetical protein
MVENVTGEDAKVEVEPPVPWRGVVKVFRAETIRGPCHRNEQVIGDVSGPAARAREA